MNEALLVSNLILWLVIIVLAVLVFALSRQVGILHERVMPAGALQPTSGPKVGELTAPLEITALQGQAETIGGASAEGLHTFVLFISPSCPVCKSLVPTAVSLIASEKGRMRLVFASDGADSEQELAAHRDYITRLGITKYPYLISQQLGMTYQVSQLPFAVLLGSDGVLRSKGLVNTREHLESLIESMDSGIPTLQDYVKSHTAQHHTESEQPVQQHEPQRAKQHKLQHEPQHELQHEPQHEPQHELRREPQAMGQTS